MPVPVLHLQLRRPFRAFWATPFLEMPLDSDKVEERERERERERDLRSRVGMFQFTLKYPFNIPLRSVEQVHTEHYCSMSYKLYNHVGLIAFPSLSLFLS